MENFQRNAEQALIGAVVLTRWISQGNLFHRTTYSKNLNLTSRYNNKSYRIDDIAWDQSPTNTFPMQNGAQISYVEYYKSQYNIHIQDLKQPLLISRGKKFVPGQTEKLTLTFSIIPEICYLTGLTDEQRSDFKVRQWHEQVEMSSR